MSDYTDSNAKKEALAPVIEKIIERKEREKDTKGESDDQDDKYSEDDEEDDDADEDTEEDEDEEEALVFEWNISDKGPLNFTSSLFPPFKGYGVFPIIATINHSCTPNTEVVFIGGNTAHLVTLRPIARGEEITISYIDKYVIRVTLIIVFSILVSVF